MNITNTNSVIHFNSPATQPFGAPGSAEEIAISGQKTMPPIEESAQAAPTSDNREKSSQNESKQQASNAEAQQKTHDQALITELKARDREVRAHEAAHAAVGGQYAGAPTYSFQRGPNGVNYAVGGEVSISTSPIANNPKATLQKAQQVQRAALAPAEPSIQDRRVAAEAATMATQAKVDLVQLKESEQESSKPPLESENSEPNVIKPTINIAKLMIDAGIHEGNQSGQKIDQLV